VEYLEEAKQIWQTGTEARPGRDGAGRVLRAVEKLRDEGCRNGNQNWGDGHQRVLAYLRQHLVGLGSLPPDQTAAITASLDRIADHEHPETQDIVYDRGAAGVVLWARAHPEPIPHEQHPALKI
jgi:hypothetical protein